MPTRAHRPDAAPAADSGARTREASVEQLAREFGEVVENAPETEREELREYAVELLREESETARQKEMERAAEGRKSPLGVFGFALLLIMSGGALLFVIPPVGIVLLFLAIPLAGWGVVQIVFAKVHTSRAASPK